MRAGRRDTEADRLVGRDRAVDRLRRALQSHDGMLVTGEAGVGKTYLARVFTRTEATGRPVLHAAGLAASRERPLGALRTLVGPTGPARGDAVAAAVLELCRAAPEGILVVDDVDAVDDASTLVLHELATRRRSGAQAPWLLLTMRAGQVLPGAVESLLTDGTLDQLRVRTLDEVDSALLVERLLDGPVEPGTAHALFRRSRGNPLFLRELVAAGHDEDLWVRRSAGWALVAAPTSEDRLQPLVQARLAALDDAARRTGRALALLGPLPVEVLHELGVLAGVRGLGAAGLASTEEQEVALAHPLFAEALLDDRAASDEGDLVRRALDLGEQADLPVAAQVRLTTAAVQQGASLDAGHLDRAARLALSLDDPGLARQLAGLARGLAPGSARARLTEARAEAALGDDDALERLVDLTGHVDPDVREEAGLAVARLQVAGPDGVRRALDVLADAQSPAAAALRAVAHLRQADWASGARDAERGVAEAEDPGEWLEAAAIRALLMITTDDLAGGLALARRGLAMLEAGALPSPYASLLLAQAATGGALLAGGPGLAEELAEVVVPDTGVGRPHTAHRTMRRGYVALHRGRLDDAARHLGSAVPLLSESDPVDIRAWTLGLLGQVHGMRGDVDGAAEAVARGYAAAEAGQVTQLTEVVRAEAWLDAARGRREEAVDRIRGLVAQGEDSPVRRSLVMLDLARLGATAEAAQGLAGLGEATRSPVVAHVEQTVLASAAGRVDETLAGAQRLVDAGLPLWAADLLAVAAEARDGADRAALQRGALLAGLACADVATPALARLQALITPTQRRVAGLAASGLGNAEIADELGMSPRTAATHLHRVYKVLGVHDREGLGRLLG